MVVDEMVDRVVEIFQPLVTELGSGTCASRRRELSWVSGSDASTWSRGRFASAPNALIFLCRDLGIVAIVDKHDGAVVTRRGCPAATSASRRSSRTQYAGEPDARAEDAAPRHRSHVARRGRRAASAAAGAAVVDALAGAADAAEGHLRDAACCLAPVASGRS